MSEEKQENFYCTDSLALTSYVELHGLKYVKSELTKGPKGKIKVLFYFLDPENKGKDLEWSFRFSDCKRYRDGLFYFRRIISEKLGTG